MRVWEFGFRRQDLEGQGFIAAKINTALVGPTRKRSKPKPWVGFRSTEKDTHIGLGETERLSTPRKKKKNANRFAI